MFKAKSSNQVPDACMGFSVSGTVLGKKFFFMWTSKNFAADYQMLKKKTSLLFFIKYRCFTAVVEMNLLQNRWNLATDLLA